MHKILLISLSFIIGLYAIEIPIEKVQIHEFGKSIELNSKIVQLSSAKQSIMTLLDGQITEYYVKEGETVNKGQKIALIESIELSKMSAEYLSLKNQYLSMNKTYEANKQLYDKGIISLEALNRINIENNEMLAKLETLTSQLETLGIETKNISNTTSKYILRAHNAGRIGTLLKGKHATVSKDTEIATVIKEQAFYLKSYIPLSYANDLKVGQKITITHNNKTFATYIDKILPELDETTQRIVVLSSINEPIDGLFINSYINSTLYINTDKKYLAVKKTALTFLNNEWVVFVPKQEAHEEKAKSSKEHNDEHDKEDKHEDKDGHKDEHNDEHNDEHKKEGDSHEEEPQYEARDVKIVNQDDSYVAIEGLNINEEYVSDKTYYVKSLVLKSSMGDGHGH
jgi:multidrug efflux pump subunit AcrA (membrane-fusion protein)